METVGPEDDEARPPPAARLLADEPLGDPGRDDEAPHWPLPRLREASAGCSPLQGATQCHPRFVLFSCFFLFLRGTFSFCAVIFLVFFG